MSTRPAVMSASSCCRAGRSIVAPEYPPSSYPAQAHPAFVPLAVDKGLAGLALRLQRIELLLEPLFGGFAGIDRASNGSAPPRAVDRRFPHRPAAATEAPARQVSPKNRGPDQWAPVIRSAITVSER